MLKKITLCMLVLFGTSGNLLAESINDKAELEKLVVQYESAVALGQECVSSKMKNVKSCQAFQKIYLSDLKDSFAAFTPNLGAYVELDANLTLRGVAAITEASGAILDIYAHNKSGKTIHSQK